MYPENVARVLDRIQPSHRVLDVGGWGSPLARADVVLDIMPYETRGRALGPEPAGERFSKSSWIIHDVGSRRPLPFEDKSFDFVVCSHVLEDIRDPIHLSAELVRVAKAGYIEVPSRTVESIRGFESPGYAGYYHHRWLVEIEGNRVVFRFKPHLMHGSRRYHLPRSFRRRLAPVDHVQWLFWEGSFEFAEQIQVSRLEVEEELERFVAKMGATSPMIRWGDGLTRGARRRVVRFLGRNPRLQRWVESRFGIDVEWRRKWGGVREIESK